MPTIRSARSSRATPRFSQSEIRHCPEGGTAARTVRSAQPSATRGTAQCVAVGPTPEQEALVLRPLARLGLALDWVGRHPLAATRVGERRAPRPAPTAANARG